MNIYRLILVFFATALTSLLGCSPDSDRRGLPVEVMEAFGAADTFDIISLDPTKGKPGALADRVSFHGWEVLGRAPLADGPGRQELIAAFNDGVAESKGEVAKCFVPRHGISVRQGDTTHDFVICFECFQVLWYTGGKERRRIAITGLPQPTFDDALKAAQLPLADKS